jgi:hypothetical protein
MLLQEIINTELRPAYNQLISEGVDDTAAAILMLAAVVRQTHMQQ